MLYLLVVGGGGVVLLLLIVAVIVLPVVCCKLRNHQGDHNLHHPVPESLISQLQRLLHRSQCS